MWKSKWKTQLIQACIYMNIYIILELLLNIVISNELNFANKSNTIIKHWKFNFLPYNPYY